MKPMFCVNIWLPSTQAFYLLLETHIFKKKSKIGVAEEGCSALLTYFVHPTIQLHQKKSFCFLFFSALQASPVCCTERFK